MRDYPWTVMVSERDDDGAYFVAEIPELPGLVVAARTRAEVWRELPAAIDAYLKAGAPDELAGWIPTATNVQTATASTLPTDRYFA